MTLDYIRDEWRREATRLELDRYGSEDGRRLAFWKDRCADPRERGFFDACKNELAASSARTLDEWLYFAFLAAGNRSRAAEVKASLGDDWNPHGNPLAEVVPDILRKAGDSVSPVVLAHLLCARALYDAGDAEMSDGPLDRSPKPIARETGVPINLVRDIQADLCGMLVRPAGGPLLLNLLLVHRTRETPKPRGVVAELDLEIVPGGAGCLYPTTEICLLRMDEDFIEAKENARRFVANKLGLWEGGCDVRWQIKLPGGRSLPPALEGGSAGAAFAIGLAKLFSGGANPGPQILRLLRKIDLHGAAIAAGVTQDGELLPVGELPAKLRAARRDTTAKIHRVVVSDRQSAEVDRDDPRLLGVHACGDFCVILARTVEEACGQIIPPGAIIDCSSELGRHSHFIGRDWLRSWLDHQVDSQPKGYLLLIGGPGVGKSAFAAHRIIGDEHSAVYHFIKRDMINWDDPDVFLPSLTAQLCRKHRLPPIDPAGNMSPAEVFQRALYQVAQGLGGRKEVIYLDGVDEAFGPTGRFAQKVLPGILPGILPTGIFIVLSSRPGRFLEWLMDPDICAQIDMSAERQSNIVDIEAYLARQNEQRGLGLDREFIVRLAKASDGFFVVAVRYLSEREDLWSELEEWRMHPDRIPYGLQGWLSAQWERIVRTAREDKIEESVVRSLLGLLALAREPLSMDHLAVFLDPGQAQDDAIRAVADKLERVLELTDEFFDRRTDIAQPYVFFHRGFQEYILLRKLPQRERREANAVLARGCKRARDEHYEGELAQYALRYVVYHFVQAGQIDEAVALMSDPLLVKDRFRAGGIYDVISDVADIARQPSDGRKAEQMLEISKTLVAHLESESEDPASFWLQLRKSFCQFFGPSAKWPPSLRNCLEESDEFAIMLFLGETYNMENDYVRAEFIFGKMAETTTLDDNPKRYVAARVRLASVLSERGRSEEALAILEKLLSEIESNAAVPRRYYWWAMYHKGVCLRRLKRWADSKETLHAVRSGDEGSGSWTSSLHQLAVVDIEEALLLGDGTRERKGKLKDAEEKLKQCLHERGDQSWNHRPAHDYHRLAQVCSLTGRKDQALESLWRGAEISTACDDLRYAQEIRESIAEFIVAPALLRKREDAVSLSELASEYRIDVADLAIAFRATERKNRCYVAEIDEHTAEQTGFAVLAKEVHETGWWHSTVSVLLIDEKGRVAIQERGEEPSRGKQDVSAAGHIVPGEDDLSSAVRETEEELGIGLDTDRLTRLGARYEFRKEGSPSVAADEHKSPTHYVYKTNMTNCERISVFLARIPDDEKPGIPGNGHTAQNVEWMSLSEAARAAKEQPQIYASAFKQLFGSDETVRRISELIDRTT